MSTVLKYTQFSDLWTTLSTKTFITVLNISHRPKPWTAMLNRPNLDYTSLFPEKPGRLPGLSVWQIENFLPVIVDDGKGNEILAIITNCSCS